MIDFDGQIMGNDDSQRIPRLRLWITTRKTRTQPWTVHKNHSKFNYFWRNILFWNTYSIYKIKWTKLHKNQTIIQPNLWKNGYFLFLFYHTFFSSCVLWSFQITTWMNTAGCTCFDLFTFHGIGSRILLRWSNMFTNSSTKVLPT